MFVSTSRGSGVSRSAQHPRFTLQAFRERAELEFCDDPALALRGRRRGRKAFLLQCRIQRFFPPRADARAVVGGPWLALGQTGAALSLLADAQTRKFG